MRLEHIHIENFQGIRALDLELPTPITLIAGRNGAGKSSLTEAIRMALGDPATRVDQKKQYGQLIADGAKVGAVSVDLEGIPVSITLPAGKRSGEAAVPTSPALPYVLAPERFALAKADDRRSLLFALTGITAKADDIETRLVARGCNARLVTAMKPILRGGFAAGAEFAKKQATDAKGAWRGVTNETYGSEKGKTWEATVPPFDAEALKAAQAALADLDSQIETAAKTVGSLEQQVRAYAAEAERRESAAARAATLPALQAKLARDEADLAQWTQRVAELQAKAGTAPREGLVHDLARAVDFFLDVYGGSVPAEYTSALQAYEAQYGRLDAVGGDPQASADLPRAIEARDLMQRSVDNDRRDIAAAEAAAEQSAAIDQNIRAVSDADVAPARGRLAELREARRQAGEKAQALLDAKQAAVSAQQRTESARLHHDEVEQWTTIADALAPDGIPGELLAEALGPVNERLASLSEIASWPTVALDRDMLITAGGRPYRLLSESERWRADALLALALADLSGLRCVILDRFDVLDMTGREDALALLDTLAADGGVDTVLLLGTLKSPPAAPSEMFTVHWLDGGRQSAQALRQAA